MAINQYYHEQYRGDFTAAGASITQDYTRAYLRHPSITDTAIYQATRSSITLPSTAKIDRAFLVWLADRHVSVTSATSSLYLRTPASPTELLADSTKIEADHIDFVQTSLLSFFGFVADVTDLVRAGGAGDYWVYNFSIQSQDQNVPLKAGWSLYVYYRDETLSFKDMSFNAGLMGLGPQYGKSSVSFVISGIKTPSQGPVLGRVGATTGFSTAGEPDSFFVESTPMSDLYTPPNDFANSISTIDNSLMDTWPEQSAPADVNNREFQTKVIALNGTEVANDVSQITVRLDMGSAPYYAGDLLSAVALSFELYEVELFTVKTVSPSGDDIGIGSILTYTVQITNASSYATGIQSRVQDVLPSTLSYVPETMEIVSNSYGGYVGPLTDAQDADVGVSPPLSNTVSINLGPDATPSAGGTLLPGDTVTLRYQAKVNGTAQVDQSITNIARATTVSKDTGGTFVSTAESTVVVRRQTEPTITKSAFPTKLHAGDIVTYEIVVVNVSGKVIPSFTITDAHDSTFFRVLSATIDIPMSGIIGRAIQPVQLSAGTWHYWVNFAELPVDGTAKLTVRMVVKPNTPAGIYNDRASLLYDAPFTPTTPPVPVEVLSSPPKPCNPCRPCCRILTCCCRPCCCLFTCCRRPRCCNVCKPQLKRPSDDRCR